MVGRAAPLSPLPASLLVGRERELTTLRDVLTAALSGRGSLVLIRGEAGIGKTALAETTLAEAERRGALALVGRCYDLSDTPPYGPWAEALARLPAADDLPAGPDLAAGGDAARATRFADVRACLASLASRRPLVLLLDDLHWADPASLGLLRFVARDLADLPILLLVAYRDDDLPRDHPLRATLPLLLHEARPLRLVLRPLSAEDLRALVRGRYALAPGDEDRLVAYLAARTGGNPLFADELLRALDDDGLLTRAVGTAALADLGEAAVPTALRQLIDARVGRLGRESQRLLACAAVVGHLVPLPLWAALADAGEGALLDVVERATAAHLLVERPGGAALSFAHPLVRETLYEDLPLPRRRELHRRAAEALLAAPYPDPDAVADHLRRAGDPRAPAWLIRAGERAERAYALLTAAERFEAATLLDEPGGDRAERGWLLVRLARMRRMADPPRALAALDEAAQLGAAVDDDALTAWCRFNHGSVRCQAGDLRAGIAELAVGIAALGALAPVDRDRLVARSEAIGHGLDEHDRRSILAFWLTLVGRFAEAEPLAARYLRPRDGAGDAAVTDPWSYADARLTLALIHTFLGRPDAARDSWAPARAAYHTAGHLGSVLDTLALELEWSALRYQPDDLVARQRLQEAAGEAWARARGAFAEQTPDEARLPLLLLEGDWPRARAALEALRDARFSARRARVARQLGPLARAMGDADLAAALVREWLPGGPGTAPGDSILPTCLALQRLAADLALDAGDLLATRAWLAAHDRWLAWCGAVLGRAEGQLGWAAYHRAAGNPTAARDHAGHALARAAAPRQPLALLAAHRTLGELATAAGDEADAATHLKAALALADACAAPYERALTLLALTELHAAVGERAAARALLAEARTLLAPLGARPALARAAALAASTEPVPPSAPPVAGDEAARLTLCEAEVLRLIAQGRTNEQIAAALGISRHTVVHHVTHILTKTGCNNRAAVVAYALRHGLA